MANMTYKQAMTEYKLIMKYLGGSEIDDLKAWPLIIKLRKSAAWLRQLSLNECNGVWQPNGRIGWSDADQASADKSRKAHELNAANALSDLFPRNVKRLVIEFNGDPRGPAIRILAAEDERQISKFW